jgi:hypothetical protein
VKNCGITGEIAALDKYFQVGMLAFVTSFLREMALAQKTTPDLGEERLFIFCPSCGQTSKN